MGPLHMTFQEDREPSRRTTTLWLGILLALHFGLRLWLSFTPMLAQADYDEAIVGLMAVHVSHGDPQIFYWGHPWIGAPDSYLAGLLFTLVGPSTLAYRLVTIFLGSLILLAVYGVGRLAGGRRAGLCAAAFWALPPIFLSFAGLYFGGGYLVSLGAAAFALYGAARLAWEPPQRPWLLALAMGTALGLGWWSTLLAMPLAVACLVGLFLAKPQLLRSWTLPALLAGFAICSAPWWWWNLGHGFASLAYVSGNSLAPGPWWQPFLAAWKSLLAVLRDSLLPSLAGAWWDGQFAPPSLPAWGRNLAGGLVYLPVLGIILFSLYQWFSRPFEKRHPWTEPGDLVVWGLLIFLLAQTLGGLGRSLPIRYSLVSHLPLAILVGLAATRLGESRPALGWAWLGLVLAFNLAGNIGFVAQTSHLTSRQAQAVADRLQGLKLSACLAHNRVGQPITFASGEKVACADWLGRRNFSYLEQALASPRPVFVTHAGLAQPRPEEMAATWRLLSARGRKEALGDYVFWWDFAPPATARRSLSAAAWRASSSNGAAANAHDRDPFTACTLPPDAGQWLLIDLGASRKLGRLTILPPPVRMLAMAALPHPGAAGAPRGIRVELSLDGRQWRTVARENPFAPGFRWRQGRPAPAPVALVQVELDDQPARFVRLTQLAPPIDGPWRIGEVFVYESAPAPPHGPPAARAMQKAREELAPFRKNPTGVDPWGPLGPGLRRSEVDFSRVLHELGRAVALAPDWEEPFIRFIAATALSGQPWPAPGPGPMLVSHQAPALFRTSGNQTMSGLAVSLSGQGEFRVSWPGGSASGSLAMGEPQVVQAPDSNGPLLVRALKGARFWARPALGPCQAGAALAGAKQYGEALNSLASCLLARGPSPPLLVEMAWCQFKTGRVEAAGRSASRLAVNYPLLYNRIIGDLARNRHGVHGPDWRRLAWPGRAFPAGKSFTMQAEDSPAPLGREVADPDANEGRAVAALPGQTKPGSFHAWFPQEYRQGRYLLRFRLKGRGQGVGVQILRHHAGRLLDQALEKRLWFEGGPGYRGLELTFVNNLEPVRLEVCLSWKGREPLTIDQVTLIPDPAGGLLPKVEVMESLPTTVGRGSQN